MRVRVGSAAVAACIAVLGCAPKQAERQVPSPAAPSAAAQFPPPSSNFTPADVHFMSGMIGHHAQAIVMSKMAPTHGANATIRTLAARIINAQQDEITLMQQWLRDRGQPVPDPSMPMDHSMAGMSHEMPGMSHELMPGMLTEEQMKQLDAARDTQFDELFLKFMIQHHQGAVTMVKELFSTEGAAQDNTAFKLASDVNVDQTTEIARMQRMLYDLLIGKEDK